MISTNSRPKLLFLCQTLPYPLDGGVNIRTHHVLRLLAERFEVTALCFFRARERSSPAAVAESVEALSVYGRIEAFPIPQEHSRWRYLLDHARSPIERRVYTRYVHESVAFRSRLRALLRSTAFDLVHVDSLDLSGYLPELDGLPVVCVHHNVESALLARRAGAETSGWRRWYVGLQSRLMEIEERTWAPRVALNVMVSQADRDALALLSPSARLTVVPNGVDTDSFQPQRGADDGLVCVGGVHGFANRDALEYFATEVRPLIPEAGTSIPVRWVGRATSRDQEVYRARFGIELTGYVPDARPYIRDAACYIVPIRVGGGTRVKILDAWAMGKALVTTSVGCEGLDARDGENALIRDTPEGFASAIRSVLADAVLRRRLEAGARRTAEETYSWSRIGERMRESYDAVLRGRHQVVRVAAASA